METGVGVIIVDGEAEVIDLVQRQTQVARFIGFQLALQDQDPVAALLARIHLEALATAHVTLIQDVTVFGFTLAGLVTQQVHEQIGIQGRLDLVLGLELVPATALLASATLDFNLGAALFQVLGDARSQIQAFGRVTAGCHIRLRGVRHGPDVVMAGLPAAGAVRELDVVGGEHHRQLHLVLRVHLAALHEGDGEVVGILPLESQIEVLIVMGSLHTDRDAAPFAGYGLALGLLAGDHLLAHIGGLLVMACGAAITAFDQRPGAAMILAGQHPLHGGLTRIENGHLTGGNPTPVDTETNRLGTGCSGGCSRSGAGKLSLLGGECLLDRLVNTLFFRLFGRDLDLAGPFLFRLFFGRLFSLFGLDAFQTFQK